MSLFGWRQRREALSNVDGPLIPSRASSTGAVNVTPETAFRHSGVWAAIRLRNNLISSFPCDNYRKVGGIQVEMPKPPVLVEPGGKRWRFKDWMYASGVDLDRAGNTIGLITERNALGLPARIDLQPIGACSVIQRKGRTELEFRIDGTVYPESKVWHERQYVIAGLPVGLSPIAYAAWSIGEYLSMQEFVNAWFAGGGVPKARLKNNARILKPKEAGMIKDNWKASVANGDLFVHGNDWEYDFMQAEQMGDAWINGRQATMSDIARFFDVPGDLIEAAVSGSSVTYANIVQRNLQLLIMSIGPAVQRREDNLSQLLPSPRFVKLNTDALLRMDPETRAKVLGLRLTTRQITPSEARALENLPPFTDADIAEIERVYGPPKAAPAAPTTQPNQAAGASMVLPELVREPIHALATVGEPVPMEET